MRLGIHLPRLKGIPPLYLLVDIVKALLSARVMVVKLSEASYKS